MVVRARSLALLAMAAMPLPAHGLIGLLKPSFGCSATTGTVDTITWGDGASFSAAPGILVDKQPGPNGFSCSANMYSAGVQGSQFAIDWGDFEPPDPADTWSPQLTISDYKVQFLSPTGAPQWKYFSNFDMYIDLLNVDGAIIHKNFVGLKIDSMYGYATGGSFQVMGDGSVMLDPSIPGGSGTLELYDTPAVPEPATLLLVGSGLLGGVLRRKRRART